MAADVGRKLTTIFCADVYGYSRLMAADEVATMERLRQFRLAMRGLIDRHAGRIVNTWGDAVIAEFASPVEAVQAAVEIQRELTGRNDALDDDHRMQFRIGINLGDVMVEGDDLYDEGVNIAARLESLADPGGIAISGPTYDQVYNKLGIGFEFLGDQSVKNIAAPVPTYRVRLPGTRRHHIPRTPRSDRRPQHHRDKPKSKHLPTFPLTMIGFFFLLNLFSGLDSIWFHWPSLPFLLMLLSSVNKHRRRRADWREPPPP